MIEALAASYTAFEGYRRIKTGSLLDVAHATKQVLDRGATGPVMVFHDATSRQAELDFRGTIDDVVARIAPEPVLVGSAGQVMETASDDDVAPRGRGRPKLGVVAREVTLLPRHWDWLNSQPGGASVALRKLVDEARRRNEARDRVRSVQETVDRFLFVMAGDLPGYEDALRAFYAKDQMRFETFVTAWPEDVRNHVHHLIDRSGCEYWLQ